MKETVYLRYLASQTRHLRQSWYNFGRCAHICAQPEKGRDGEGEEAGEREGEAEAEEEGDGEGERETDGDTEGEGKSSGGKGQGKGKGKEKEGRREESKSLYTPHPPIARPCGKYW